MEVSWVIGVPQSSSISRWNFPWNKPTSYWGTPIDGFSLGWNIHRTIPVEDSHVARVWGATLILRISRCGNGGKGRKWVCTTLGVVRSFASRSFILLLTWFRLRMFFFFFNSITKLFVLNPICCLETHRHMVGCCFGRLKWWSNVHDGYGEHDQFDGESHQAHYLYLFIIEWCL